MGRKLPKVLSPAEQERLLDQFNPRYDCGLRNHCIVRVMLDVGLRSGEVVALQPDHLDMKTCRLTVREGKGAKDRTLWISSDLRDLIGDWLDRRPESPWLFPTRKGTKLSTRYLRQMIKTYSEKAAISEMEKVSPHTLRHTFATDLYRETGNIRLVQKSLGHADLSTTMIYTHIVDDELEEALKNFRG